MLDVRCFLRFYFSMLLPTVIRTIRRHNLLTRGQHILVGVSGGADSVALLAVLRRLAPAWKFRLTVAHLNHGIRGPAAAADAAFVADLARRWKLEFVGAKVNVPLRARRRGISLEMAGRAARYDFFGRAARAYRCDAVATAHTADDQAETTLLNLARGAGAAGLAGIPYIGRHGAFKVVRPLRDVNRKSIERFLAYGHLAWREDATNSDLAFLRNRVRHEVLPFLEKRLNPGIRQALLRVSDILAEENKWLNVLAKEILEQCRVSGRALNARRLAGFPVAARRRVLRLWLEARGLDAEALSFDAIERLDNLAADRRGGRAATLAGGWLVRREADTLALSVGRRGNVSLLADPPAADKPQRFCPARSATHSVAGGRTAATPPAEFRQAIRCSSRSIERQSCRRPNLSPASAPPFSARLSAPGQTLLPGQGIRITARIGPGIVKERPALAGALPARASLSLRAWRKRRLVARSWKPGDRMRPFGLQGAKKLQDIFSDAKTPPVLRYRLPVIECGGEIVWIPGFRIAQGWAVGPGEVMALQLTVE